MITSKLTSKAQTTIPQSVRGALRLSPGDELAYAIEEGRVILTKSSAGAADDPFGPLANGLATRTPRPMPTFEAGDTVKVPFPYTDRATRQRRPALVVSKGGIGDNAALLWVVMITSAENRPWPGDLPLGASQGRAGLGSPSVIRACKIATVEARDVEPLGRVSAELLAGALHALQANLPSG